MTITRKTKTTGQHVKITTRSGSTHTGTIKGWGIQVLDIRPTDGGRYGWKVESFHNHEIAHVETIEA
jgi:hypothetical protein